MFVCLFCSPRVSQHFVRRQILLFVALALVQPELYCFSLLSHFHLLVVINHFTLIAIQRSDVGVETGERTTF